MDICLVYLVTSLQSFTISIVHSFVWKLMWMFGRASRGCRYLEDERDPKVLASNCAWSACCMAGLEQSTLALAVHRAQLHLLWERLPRVFHLHRAVFAGWQTGDGLCQTLKEDERSDLWGQSQMLCLLSSCMLGDESKCSFQGGYLSWAVLWRFLMSALYDCIPLLCHRFPQSEKAGGHQAVV